MKTRPFLAMALALALLLAMLPSRALAGPSPRSEPPGRSLAAGPLAYDGETWLVTWSGTAAGHSDETAYGTRTVKDELMSVGGSAITRYSSHITPDNPTGWKSDPFKLTVTHGYQEQETSSCYAGGTDVWRTQSSIIDPTHNKLLGQETPIDTTYVWPQVFQAGDGSYYMPFPLSITQGGYPRFPANRKVRHDPCSGAPYTKSTDYYDDVGIMYPLVVGTGACRLYQMDATATTFSRQCSYVVTSSPPLTVNWNVHAIRLPDTPEATQTPELLESNIYLPGVPVADNLATELAHCDGGSCMLTRETQPAGQAATVEQSGPYGNTTVPKVEHIENMQPGTTRVSVQATKGPSQSPADTNELKIALVLGKWTGGAPRFTVEYAGGVVIYKFWIGLPKTPFKAEVDVPSFVPFFGGRKLGISDTTLQLDIEGRSSGQVSGTGKAESAFKIAEKSVKAGFSAGAKGQIDGDGIAISDGQLGLSVSGSVGIERPLFEVFPQLLPAWNLLKAGMPRLASALADRAKASLEAGPELGATVNFHEDPTSEGPEFTSANIPAGLKTKVAVSIDILGDGTVKLSGSIGGGFTAQFHMPEPYFKGAVLELTTEGQLVLFKWITPQLAQKWSTTFGAAALPQPASMPAAAPAGGRAWQLQDRSYEAAPDYARWTAPGSGSGPNVPAALNAGATDVQLAENVYRQAQPALATQANRRLLLWVHERPDVPEGQELAFSTSYGAGGAWNPQSLATNDDRGDYTPRVTFLTNGTALALWQRFDTATPGDPNSDLAAYLSHVQIAAAKGTWNGVTWLWGAPQTISAAGSYNARHRLGATTTGALAVWVGNAAGQVIGDTANPDALLFARYTTSTNTWTAAAPVVADPAQLSGLLDVQLATAGAAAAVVYSRDMDGDMSTSADRELFAVLWNGTSWGAPMRLTNNTMADDLPLVALTSSGAPELVWRQAGALQFMRGSWTAAPVPLDLAGAASAGELHLASLANGMLALVWSQVSTHDTRIGYAVYDSASSLWSKPLALQPPITATMSMAEGLSPALETGRLLIAYPLAAVDEITATVGGITLTGQPAPGARSLHYVEVPLDLNLSLAPGDLTAAPAGAQPGEPITITAAIHNGGKLGVSTVQVDLVDNYLSQALVSRSAGPIVAGGVVTVTFPFTQPVTRDRTYSITVDPNHALNETNRNDNSAVVGFAPKLTAQPTLATVVGVQAAARLELAGGLGSGQILTASLRLDHPQGPELGTSLLSFPLTGTAAITATEAFSATQLGPGRHLLYWMPAGPAAAASQPYAVSGADVLPDLTTRPEMISYGRTPGASAPIRLWLFNDGNWPSAPVQLAAFDGDPAQAGTHRLATLPAPAIAPGSFVTVTGTLDLAGLPAANSGLATLYLQIDPDNALAELDRNNNLIVDGPLSGNALPVLDKHTDLPLIRR